MNKTLVLYYSLEGNVDFLCKALANEASADLCRLETVKEYPKKGLMKFIHGGRDASFGFKPELKNSLPELSQYQSLVLGTPVWAGKMSAPLNTYINQSDFTGKYVYLLVSSAGGNAEKCISQITQLVEEKGGIVKDTLSFVNPKKNVDSSVSKIKDFVKKMA